MKESGVGIKIKELRIGKKLSQAELGAKLGFSARTVSDWECNNTEPDIKTIRKIVEFFNIDFNEFFE